MYMYNTLTVYLCDIMFFMLYIHIYVYISVQNYMCVTYTYIIYYMHINYIYICVYNFVQGLKASKTNVSC